MKILINELNEAKSKEYKKELVQAFSMCCWYSLEQTLTILQSAGVLDKTLKLIFDYIEKVKKDIEIRRLIYGLITLIEEHHLLPSVRVGVSVVFEE